MGSKVLNIFIVSKYAVLMVFFRAGGIPARNHRGERIFLYIGIIDILQNYRMAKKLEHTFKSMLHEGVRPLTCFLAYISISYNYTPCPVCSAAFLYS